MFLSGDADEDKGCRDCEERSRAPWKERHDVVLDVVIV
jgi:hypothetical protein